MNDLHKAAMQQALDALEWGSRLLVLNEGEAPNYYAAIAALREALAAPVVPEIDYTVLHAFSESQNVSYNETCAMVRNAIAAAPKPKEQTT